MKSLRNLPIAWKRFLFLFALSLYVLMVLIVGYAIIFDPEGEWVTNLLPKIMTTCSLGATVMILILLAQKKYF